jgi:hypothetical protein
VGYSGSADAANHGQGIQHHNNTYAQKNLNFYLTLSGSTVESFPKLPHIMARKQRGKRFPDWRRLHKLIKNGMTSFVGVNHD